MKRNLIGLLKFAIGAGFNYLAYIILHSLGLLAVFNEDLCPRLSAEQFLWCVGGILTILLVWSVTSVSTSDLHIAIKKYESTICVCMFTLGIIVWEKCRNQPQILLTYALELLVLYLIIEYETARIFKYKYADQKDALSNYTEKPIVGRQLLTEKQEDALNQLVRLLDESTRSCSFNIAFIGGWGTGKTSVTDTLISELQKRKRAENQYFILKISTQAFSGTGDIVEYVKKYFHCLFEYSGPFYTTIPALGNRESGVEETALPIYRKPVFRENGNR